jgi:signal transduction histidine kinase
MRFNIRTKIIIAVSLSLVLIFAVIMYLLVTRNIDQLRSDLNEQSKSFAALAATPIGNTFLLYQDSGSIRITQQVNKFLDLDQDVTAVKVVSVEGEVLYSSQPKDKRPVSPRLAGAFTAQYVKDDSGYIREAVQPYFEDSGAHRYSVAYEISSERVKHSINDTVRLILYVGVAILIVSIATTTWLLNNLFIRPLRDVSRSANIISSGNFDQEIVPKNKDEIGDLAVSVNKMAEFLKADIVKLRDLDKLKTEFMMIASHNLRTPLSVMRGYIEMAAEARSVDELRAIIKTVQESVTRLHLLAEDLLTISTLEAGGGKMVKTPAGAKEFIDSVVTEFELLATKKDLHWQFTNDVPETAKLDLSQSNMRSALANLIDNAIKFTKEGGAVRVLADVRDDKLAFTVDDTGIGVTPEEIPKLFTKFHRGTSTAQYDYEGVGIGLYLTKLIVTEHSGQVIVKSEAGKGSTFTVYLPLAGSGSPSGPA